MKATQKGASPMSNVALATFVMAIAICQQAKSAAKKIPAQKAIAFSLVPTMPLLFFAKIIRKGIAMAMRQKAMTSACASFANRTNTGPSPSIKAPQPKKINGFKFLLLAKLNALYPYKKAE